ncbi:acyl carrier protein, partial [Pseudomonas syringae group genomosp. 7]|uniref:acyl carrier protein n=1 Tax=Pseudomonas syringae group genomosp. 7 TaxID=251699 RepID=UPI00376F8147
MQVGVKSVEVVMSACLVEVMGADSVDSVVLVLALEVEFESEIPDEEGEKFTTVLAA